jgi:hypothetical protein
MFAEFLVRRPVFFLMVTTAVENYEAAFAGVEASLGLADCALVFVREGGGGRHLDCIIVWWSKENDQF